MSTEEIRDKFVEYVRSDAAITAITGGTADDQYRFWKAWPDMEDPPALDATYGAWVVYEEGEEDGLDGKGRAALLQLPGFDLLFHVIGYTRENATDIRNRIRDIAIATYEIVGATLVAKSVQYMGSSPGVDTEGNNVEHLRTVRVRIDQIFRSTELERIQIT